MSQRKKLVPVLVLCFIFFLSGPLAAGSTERHEWSDMAAVVQAADSLAAKSGGASQVLLVFDADNTLLRLTSSLGSDQWFIWQSGLLAKAPEQGPSPYLGACDFQELLKVQGILFFLGSMVPPEPSSPGIVQKLQAGGFPSMVLTSRGADYRDMTMRELRRNGYEFKAGAPKLRSDAAFDPGANASYEDGVFMTSGQDKGRMLALLLASVREEFKAIVFVDDSVKHVDRALNMPGREKYDICAVRYGREDNVVKDFLCNRDGVQDTVKAQWDRLKAALLDVWGRTGCSQPILLRDCAKPGAPAVIN